MSAAVRLALLALLGSSAPAMATDIVVRVAGVVGDAGFVRVGVCLKSEYPKRCRHGALAPARAGTVEVTVPVIAPGRYALLAHHDRAGDGVVHTDWFGIPTDGVGISRDAIGRFGLPGFEAAAIDIAGPRAVVEIALRREPS